MSNKNLTGMKYGVEIIHAHFHTKEKMAEGLGFQ